VRSLSLRDEGLARAPPRRARSDAGDPASGGHHMTRTSFVLASRYQTAYRCQIPFLLTRKVVKTHTVPDLCQAEAEHIQT
jgi:hypothetical protein